MDVSIVHDLVRSAHSVSHPYNNTFDPPSPSVLQRPTSSHFTSVSTDPASAPIPLLVMFVVTALHTKRRPRISIHKPSATTEKHRVERLPAAPYSHRYSHPVKLSSLSSSQAACRVSEPSMAPNDNDRHGSDRNKEGKRLPVKALPGRRTPSRVRKFIPKPLVLVERMKARQFLLNSPPPVISDSCVAPESSNRSTAVVTVPFSTYVTPTTHQTSTRNVPSFGSHSSSNVSFRRSPRKDVAFGTSFATMSRSLRPLSVVTLADSSSTTDTFVADSPCYIKQAASKFPVLAVANVQLDIKSAPDKKAVTATAAPLLVDPVALGFVHQTINTFEPVMTSTPFAPSQVSTYHVPSPTTFITSTICPTRRSERTPGFFDGVEIVSPTSRDVYPFNAPKGAYVVKLPTSVSTVSLSNRTNLASSSSTPMSCSRPTNSGAPPATFANSSRSALHFKRFSSRVASPSPRLVLDGIFALPRAPPPPLSSSSPQGTPNAFPRPRKLTSRRGPSGISNAHGTASPSQHFSMSPILPSRGQPGPESPRSKLARVLTAHVRPETMAQACKRAYVPLLVKVIPVSNDPRTQCGVEGLVARRAVGLGCGDGGDSNGRGALERMSLASVGMVAKLRARWEAGVVEHRGC